MSSILSLKSNKYELQLNNFEGPLDLLCYLIDKNQMDIYQIEISKIADQYIDYLKRQEELNLEIASEFLVMASTLLLIKSKGLLPKENDDESELTEEELLKRIIEYKQYKEISKIFKERINLFSKRFEKTEEKIEFPTQVIEKKYQLEDIVERYNKLLEIEKEKKNENAKNIEKIALHDNFSVADKVKDMFRELVKNRKFVFNKLFSVKEKPKEEIVTAFSGMLELSRRDKIETVQETTFGDITVLKKKKNIIE